MAKFLSKLSEPFWNWASRRYQAAVGKELKKYGLRYDDLYDELYDVDIQEALSRLPKHVVDARSARIKRAMDASMKHVYLPKELQAKQTPYEFYLQEALEQVKLEREERNKLGSSMPYSRELP
jgi:ubiquinol-cytochrome c reductase subunit 7